MDRETKDMALPQLEGACVCIGVFDGYHLGHKALIESCIADAARKNAKSVIVTFDIDPDELFGRDIEKIMSNAQRLKSLEAAGANEVVALKFDEELAMLEPGIFMDSFFGDSLPRSIHVGDDFRFGKKGAGDVSTLREWCRKRGVLVISQDLIEQDGDAVKSTRIRHLLHDGKISEANRLLGHPYTICGPVTHGRGEGAEFGFATANVESECILSDGVYAGRALVDSKEYPAAISVGIPPTFKDSSKDALEVHILDFEGDLYDREICVAFIDRIRPMIKFDSVDDLINRVKQDIEFVRGSI